MLFRKIVTLGICVMMLLQTTAVFAGTFSDLKDSEWAETYIEKMASKGVITGFNGEYKPMDPVNKYSAVVMIYRTLKAAGKLDDVSVNAAVSKYASVLASNNVPIWPDLHQAVAWMLETGVIQQEELKYFMTGENQTNARRYELSIFLGKALNVFLKENVNTFISLSFKDANLISSGSAPYVNLLVKKNILNGDVDGSFKPYDPINRAAMAKVLAVSYDLLSATSAVQNPVTVPVTTTSSLDIVTKEGTITYVMSDSRKIILTDKTDTSKTDIYTIGSTVKIYASGVVKDFSAIAKDLSAKLTLTNGVLTRIDLGSWTTTPTNSLTVQKVEDRSGYYRIEATDSNNTLKTYLTTNDVKTITLDGVVAPISKLLVGNSIQIRTNDSGYIIEISATTTVNKYEGVLKSPIKFDGKPQLVLQTDNATEVTLELGTDVTIRRNDASATAAELMVGDYVSIRTDLNKITRIEAYSMSKSTLNGVIEQLIFARTNQITVKPDEGVARTFDLPPTAVITIDGKTSEMYDLRVNYRLDINLEGTSIVKIVAKKSSSKDQLAGVITKVYKDLNLMTLKATGVSGTQYLTVTFNSATKFISSTGGTVSYTTLEADKSVFIYGYYQDNFFLAERVIMVD